MCRIHEYGSFLVRSTAHQAKDKKICEECRRSIAVGEAYLLHRFLDPWGQDFSAYTLCQHCQACINWLSDVCNNWCMGQILEEIIEHHEERPEDPGLILIKQWMPNKAGDNWAVSADVVQQTINWSVDYWKTRIAV